MGKGKVSSEYLTIAPSPSPFDCDLNWFAKKFEIETRFTACHAAHFAVHKLRWHFFKGKKSFVVREKDLFMKIVESEDIAIKSVIYFQAIHNKLDKANKDKTKTWLIIVRLGKGFQLESR